MTYFYTNEFIVYSFLIKILQCLNKYVCIPLYTHIHKYMCI